jgi:hypothetical protein
MSHTASDRARVRENHQEQLIHHRFLFERVTAAYIDISELPLLIALDYDPDATRSRTLTHDAINFRIDVERATEQALADFPALQRAWFHLACGDKVDVATQRAVITRCGRFYQQRGLDPNKYFLRYRQTLPWERRVA